MDRDRFESALRDLATHGSDRGHIIDQTRGPLGLISDGDPVIQRAKLDGLGLARFFTSVVLSDEHGRAHRKANPLPFRRALNELGVEAGDAVYIGDRPAKDVAGAVGAGMRAIRVQTGEWRGDPDDPRAWASVATVTDAVDLIWRTLPPASAMAAAPSVEQPIRP